MSNLDQYRIMHEKGHFPGNSTQKWSKDIAATLSQHGAKRILDYGSGKGRQYAELKLHEDWGVPMPELYDPAWPPLATMPDGVFDAVLCIDVLEHLEDRELYAAISDCMHRASKCVFFAIACRKAGKSLPDGRNCHLTIHSPDWWRGYIRGVREDIGAPDALDVVLRFET